MNVLLMVVFIESSLSNFKVGIGNVFDESNFISNNFNLCKHFTDTIPKGISSEIDCDSSPLEGSFIAVWMEGVSNTRLTLCEVEVYLDHKSKIQT